MLVRLLAASGALEVHARTLRELRRELAAKAAKQPRLQAARCGGSAAAGGLRPLRPLGCFAALAASSLGAAGEAQAPLLLAQQASSSLLGESKRPLNYRIVFQNNS